MILFIVYCTSVFVYLDCILPVCHSAIVANKHVDNSNHHPKRWAITIVGNTVMQSSRGILAAVLKFASWFYHNNFRTFFCLALQQLLFLVACFPVVIMKHNQVEAHCFPGGLWYYQYYIHNCWCGCVAEDKHISIRGKQHLMVYSNRPLPPFADEEMVDASTGYVLPDLFPISPTIDLRKQHVWRPENITGCIDCSALGMLNDN